MQAACPQGGFGTSSNNKTCHGAKHCNTKMPHQDVPYIEIRAGNRQSRGAGKAREQSGSCPGQHRRTDRAAA